MDFADYPGLNGELAADFHARHFVRRDTHVYDPNHVSHLPPYNAAALAGLAVDVKPRLTKEQHDVLENEFQKQSKPNTNTKKRFAEILGVSLDKVNNWFQNRRAKSKQDAKKQAGAFNLLQATQQQTSFPAINAMSSMNPDNVSPTYCAQDPFSDGAMSSAPSYSQNDNQTHMMGQDFAMGNHLQMENLGSIPMQPQRSQHQHIIGQDSAQDDLENRRTLTQAQYDVFGDNSNAFVSASTEQANPALSATITNPSEIYGQYDFPDLCDFDFDDSNNDAVTSTPMRPSQSTESYLSHATTHSETLPSSLPNYGQAKNPSARSDSSTPSVSITPAQHEAEAFDFDLGPHAAQPPMPTQPVSAGQWQPGQSIPVDLATLQQEFEAAAMRNRTQSVPSIPNDVTQNRFMEQPLAYPIDEAFSRRESSTNQLARSMQNFSMTNQRAAMPSTTIAARRQRPRPAPLGGASLRSTSYCGQLPTSPGHAGGSHGLQSAGQSLRRIKSSQTMNGIANGRIQKNVGSAQRSPSGVAFADVANAGRYARRVSSFSPAFAGIQAASAGLAPPTPMSPSSYANLQPSAQALTQASISESDGDPMSSIISSSNQNFSPPTTPIYTAMYPRGRLGSTAITENTPPQSAPATQQCFPSTTFQQNGPHIQQNSALQSQPTGFVPMMPNEYPQMPNVVFPTQQQSLQGQYMDMPMSYIMTNTGEVHVGYALVPPFAQQQLQHQSTPPNAQHPFVPSSNSSPGVMVSSQVRKQSTPAADFFVHEYTPPQDVKQSTSPRKALDTGPKNYTFSNHGPEYFERNVKKEESSPTSSAGGSFTA